MYFLDFGDDLIFPKRDDVYLKKDENLENFYEIQEKLGEWVNSGLKFVDFVTAAGDVCLVRLCFIT